MLQLAEKVLKLTGSRSKLCYRPAPIDDPKQRQPDISVAGEKLGWLPRVQLEAGLLQTIAYFRALLESNVTVPGRSDL